MNARRILVLGAGRLAMSLTQALPAAIKAAGNATVHVLIATRDEQKAMWAAVCGNASSRCIGAPVTFSHTVIDWNREAAIQSVLNDASADMIVLAASLQSVSMIDQGSVWGQLINKCGYGVTVAFQAALLSKLQRNLEVVRQQPVLINACLPDVVNGWSMAAGRRVDIGIGNVTFLSEVVRQRLGLRNETQLYVFAGHWDIAESYRNCANQRRPFRIWRGTKLLDETTTRTIGSLPPDSWISPLAGSVNARLLAAIASGANGWNGHAPGVAGRLGGLPIAIRNGQILLRLPQDMPEQVAERLAYENIAADGIECLEGSSLYFTNETAGALARLSTSLSASIKFSDVEEQAEELLEVRRRYA